MDPYTAQIAGGSGLTPMLQIAQEVVRNPEDKTLLTLVFANVSEDDILLKKELDDMAKKHSKFKVSSNSGDCLCPVAHLHMVFSSALAMPQCKPLENGLNAVD